MKKQEIIEKYGEEEYRRRLEYAKQYVKQHKEQIKQYNKEYYHQHKEYMKEYREQRKEYMQQYKQQHKAEYREYRLKYHRKNDCMFVYCVLEEIEQIENYELAKKDNFVGWCIHHRLETHNSDGEKRLVNLLRTELIALDMYYNRPADELIFLTKSEHTKLHRRRKNID